MFFIIRSSFVSLIRLWSLYFCCMYFSICHMVHTGQGKHCFFKVRENIVSSRSGKSQGILIDSLPNRHSTYGYGSLLKIAVKKDRKNLIEHPILYRDVFIYIHITAYCLHIFDQIQVVSNLARRLKGVCVPCLQTNIQGWEFPVV